MGQRGFRFRQVVEPGKTVPSAGPLRSNRGIRPFDRRCHPFPQTLVADMPCILAHDRRSWPSASGRRHAAVRPTACRGPLPRHRTELRSRKRLAIKNPIASGWLPDGRPNAAGYGRRVRRFSAGAATSSPPADQFSRAGRRSPRRPRCSTVRTKSADPLAAPTLRHDGPHAGGHGQPRRPIRRTCPAKVKLRERDADLDPSARNAWETDETVKLPVAGSVFVFNQVTGSTPDGRAAAVQVARQDGRRSRSSSRGCSRKCNSAPGRRSATTTRAR